jgi:hypothetical protein
LLRQRDLDTKNQLAAQRFARCRTDSCNNLVSKNSGLVPEFKSVSGLPENGRKIVEQLSSIAPTTE